MPEAAKVEEFAKLDFEIQAFKAKIKRHQDLLDEILGYFQTLDGGKPAKAEGTTFDVIISAADNKREVTPAGKQKLKKLWGAVQFLKNCSISLKHLPDPKDTGNLYSISERTGPRHLSPVPRLQQAA
jgi:hypothetical protein